MGLLVFWLISFYLKIKKYAKDLLKEIKELGLILPPQPPACRPVDFDILYKFDLDHFLYIPVQSSYAELMAHWLVEVGAGHDMTMEKRLK